MKVNILPRAVLDLEEIVDYLSDFSIKSALEQYDRLVEKINNLPAFPFLYPVYKPGRYKFEYRKLVVDNYLVFYVVLDDVIEIHYILHEKRNLTKYFEIEE